MVLLYKKLIPPTFPPSPNLFHQGGNPTKQNITPQKKTNTEINPNKALSSTNIFCSIPVAFLRQPIKINNLPYNYKMKKTLSALALSAVSAISGYASANQLSFSYAQGETSHIQNQRIEVLDSIDTFFDYIADRGDRPPEETPAFNINYDFAETPYIAIHHGARKSSGYSLVPTKIVEKADRTVIFVEEQYPDEATCFNTLSATYPYALIQMRERMPFGKPFEVRFMKKAVEC